MAFGSSMKEAPAQTERKEYEPQFLNIKDAGMRTIRLLPVVDGNGEFEGIGETTPEIRFAEIWWVKNSREIKANPGNNIKEIKHKVIVDWTQPWKNPIWEDIKAVYENEDKDRPKIKNVFALNVLDRTLVLPDETGVLHYVSPNDRRQYVTAQGKVLKGTPKPANKVVVLTGSTGKEGGRHLFQELCDLLGTVDHPTNGETQLPLHMFDIKLKISGSGFDTRRSFQVGSNFEPLPKELLQLPRWNIEEYVRPWPNEMLQRLVDGEPYKDLVQEYKIMLFPRRFGDPSPYDKKETEEKVTDEELFD